ncbi:hypothetical protein [Microbulbifer sp. JMSA008]|jgi:hypothetical protein|uniref:hypothetical protein n=1 Tax=Microbulbifer sp. JMSA008 TaxID=3243373 RepID=UPI00403939D1
MKIDRSNLLLSAQRALLFNISSAMRFISIEVSLDNKLKVLAYVQRELNEDELDMIYSAAGEICGDFVELEDSDVEVRISSSNYENVKSLKFLVFARAE